MKNLFALSICLLSIQSIQAQPDTIQQVIAGRLNDPSQQAKPYVILISIDGFRADYATMYHAENLLRLVKRGVIANHMISSYPSLTFPNHYSLITGMYPAHHGLVDNSFYDWKHKTTYDMHDKRKAEDSSWYGGLPLWVIAEKQHMLAASFYWVGSDAAIAGVRPTYYFHYNELIPTDRRLQIVKDWLHLPEANRPHLITLYFPEVDHAGHDHGPESRETEEAVHHIDQTIGKLAALTDSLRLPINFIVVSDHGMMTVDTEHPVPIPAFLLDTAVCRLTTGSTLLHVYLKDKSRTQSLYEQLKKEAHDFDVNFPDQTLPAWHYAGKDDRGNRIGDIILMTQPPKVFKVSKRPITPGKHGFDPTLTDMHATFIAWGPQIRNLGAIKPFENVNVYPLITQLLGLRYSHPIDGRPDVLKYILK